MAGIRYLPRCEIIGVIIIFEVRDSFRCFTINIMIRVPDFLSLVTFHNLK